MDFHKASTHDWKVYLGLEELHSWQEKLDSEPTYKLRLTSRHLAPFFICKELAKFHTQRQRVSITQPITNAPVRQSVNSSVCRFKRLHGVEIKAYVIPSGTIMLYSVIPALRELVNRFQRDNKILKAIPHRVKVCKSSNFDRIIFIIQFQPM